MGDAGARIGGRYRMDRQLASGGMGTVWLGWDELLQRPVAIKRLHLQHGFSAVERDVVVQRAMREARITARLHHSHAVQVYDVADDVAGPCLIMQYVPSRSLHDIVRDQGPLPPNEVARIGTQVAAALAAAHRAGIVHRDVKPGNVLIVEDGTAKITDFGISHAFDDVSLTSTGMVTGTPAYLAPEVARGADSNSASDVYSLGSTLYLAVEGRPPFGSDANPMAVLHRVASGQPQPPVRSGPLTPMLQAMMASDPAQRPSMVEIATALPDLHPITSDPQPASGSPTSATQVLPRQRPPVSAPVVAAGGTRAFAAPPPARPADPVEDRERHRSWLPLAAAALVVALGAVLAIVLLRGTGDDSPTAGGPTPGVSTPAKHPSSVSPSPSRVSSSSVPSTSTSAHRGSGKSKPAKDKSKKGPVTDQELAKAVVGYFQLVPAHLDAAWDRLTPHFQGTRAHGRGSFDAYWKSIRRVDVSGARGQAPHTASAKLVYHYKSGQVVSQQTRFRFVRQDGVLKIDGQS